MSISALEGTPELAQHVSALGDAYHASADYAHIAISDEIRARCQTTVDLMSELHDIPCAVVTRLHENHLEVVAASTLEDHPFKAGLVANLDAGTCCEAVMAGHRVLLVPNKLEDPVFRGAPTVAAGFTAYLGMPILWPNGDVFGTIALLDRKANPFSEAAVRLLEKFKETVESDVELLVRLDERDRANRELVGAKEAAEAASRAKSLFLASMSHELRTPLNAVLGFTQLLTRDAGLTAAQRERMGIIERSGRHLLAQIDEVLEMSRIEAGTVSVDDGAVEVRALCDEVAEMFVVPCERKGLALEVIIDGDVPAWIRGDAAKLGRVLVNLVGNAVKYTERGGIGLRVVRAGEGAVAFEVQDTGPGLARGDIERLFEPFARGEQGRATSGTGLGLSITRELTALLGGRVDVESEPGRGSCFRVVLPLREAGAAASPAAEPPIAELRAPGGGALPAVLVVEDQAENRRLMAELLEPLGFAVTLAESGEAAVARFAVASAGVVLMDLRMPGVDGGEAARRIRALPGGAAAAIVAVTASAFRDEGAEVVAAPFDAVVRKPFRADRLLEVVAEHAGLEVVRGAVAPARSAPVELAAGDFAALPGDVVATLHQAAIAADGERIERVLGAIAATHAGLCDGVRDLLDSYRFDRLAALTIAS